MPTRRSNKIKGASSTSAYEPFLGPVDWETVGDLWDKVATEEPIAFVGAGLSARVGYGDWNKLVGMLGAELTKLQKTAAQIAPKWSHSLNDLAWVAEAYRLELEKLKPGRYAQILGEFFGPPKEKSDKTPDAAIANFARIAFMRIVTTNYDETIERAVEKERQTTPQVVRWWEEDDVKDFMGTLTRRPANPQIIYLHGRHNEPENIVLSESDYVSQYVKSDFTVRKLFAMFSTRRVAFFGFSLDDADIAAIFRQVNSIHGNPRHFAVLGLEGDAIETADATRQRLSRKFGIEPIFFEVDAKNASQDRYHRLVEVTRLLSASEKPARRVSEAKPQRIAETPAASQTRTAKRWTTTPTFKRITNESDPQKGRFGGLASRDGYQFTANVKETNKDSGWFRIRLQVSRRDNVAMTRPATFFVHDSFRKERYEGELEDGQTVLELGAYGAFTVGALVNEDRTPLELDLAELPQAPQRFRER